MTVKYSDQDSYQFHERDSAHACYVCNCKPDKLLIVRQTRCMELVHICKDCLLENLSDYLLDNTRPWRSEK